MMLKLFFVLAVFGKFAGFIDWSWWLVLIPGYILLAKSLIEITYRVGLENRHAWAINFAIWLQKR